MNWLWDNKEWLFSGVGAIVFTTLVTLSWRLARRRPSVATLSATHHAPLSFDEVMRAMKDVPPLQIRATGARFVGIGVRWPAFLANIAAAGRDDVDLALDSGPGAGTVHCTVKLSRYKVLSYMRPGEPITVSGTIERVELRDVFLRDAKLEFGNLSTPRTT